METEDLDKALDKYYKRFGDIFPTMEYRGQTEAHLIKVINECLEKNKSAKELLGLTPEDKDINY